jgi:hypothetical protein
MCLLWLGLLGLVRASDDLAPVTLDFPLAPNLTLPDWLGQPELPATDFATLNLPILTPDATSSLLVTVYFQEKQGGFMRITWKGTQDAQVLSDNFYENTGIANQRSLLISPSTLLGDGILSLQCGDATLGIQRIKLEWLQNKVALASPGLSDLLVKPSVGPTQTGTSVNGQPNATEPGAWDGDIVTVPMTDSSVRIDDSEEFSVDLDKVPASGRLALKEEGLPFGHRLVVWVNHQRAGTITPAVPDLLDGGYLPAGGTTGAPGYAGWRDGSFYIPVALLKAGENALQFSEDDEAAAASANTTDSAIGMPLAIKAFVVQLNYQATSPATVGAAPLNSSTPSGPSAPADSTPTTYDINAP